MTIKIKKRLVLARFFCVNVFVIFGVLAFGYDKLDWLKNSGLLTGQTFAQVMFTAMIVLTIVSFFNALFCSTVLDGVAVCIMLKIITHVNKFFLEGETVNRVVTHTDLGKIILSCVVLFMFALTAIRYKNNISPESNFSSIFDNIAHIYIANKQNGYFLMFFIWVPLDLFSITSIIDHWFTHFDMYYYIYYYGWEKYPLYFACLGLQIITRIIVAVRFIATITLTKSSRFRWLAYKNWRSLDYATDQPSYEQRFFSRSDELFVSLVFKVILLLFAIFFCIILFTLWYTGQDVSNSIIKFLKWVVRTLWSPK